VTNPEHEHYLRQQQAEGTGSRVQAEKAHDLSYRGILPRELARTIHGDPVPATEETIDTESFALQDQQDQISSELEATSKRHMSLARPLRVQHLLLLGLREIRYEYMRCIDLWDLLHPAVQAASPSLGLPPPTRNPTSRSATALPRRIQAWLLHPAGRMWLRDLRALLPSPQIAHARVSRDFNIGRSSLTSIVLLLQPLGVPIRLAPGISLGPFGRSWSSLREQWARKCSCSPCHSPPGLCLSCGLASPSAASPSATACYLCDRNSPNGPFCHCCGSPFHFQQDCLLGHGVHPLYRANFFSGGTVCPDCIWSMASDTPLLDPVHVAAWDSMLSRQRSLA
jgi:hypothetical protein